MKEQVFDPSNFNRTLTMAEKAVKRLIRRNYHNPSQWPDIIHQILDAFDIIRSWMKSYKLFSIFKNYHLLLGLCLKELSTIIAILIIKCKEMNGKKITKKSRKQKEQYNLIKSINQMMEYLEKFIVYESSQNANGFGSKFEIAILKAFEKNCLLKIRINKDSLVSGRGNKTYIFPWSDPDTYLDIVNDKKRFRSVILEKLIIHQHKTGHKKTCKDSTKYKLYGYRAKPRRTKMSNGLWEFPIRIIKCKDCGEQFSLLPSFLPREKNFGINIIGNVVENMLRFSMSIQGAMQNLKTLLPQSVKSKQTILNWIRWMGTHHPAVVLNRAGVSGSGYLQEDEGFEKEPQLRTYSVVMVDPKYLLVWHSDYVDHVDEGTLANSFERFMQKIDFKILGVTKDKWIPSTKALKTVFKNIWLGFCHRHYLKKLFGDLLKYQEKEGCDRKEINRLYKKIKKILKTSNSKISLVTRLKSMKEAAFDHILLRPRIDDLKNSAVYYTSNQRRKGISQTTSIVDNFLKNVKRKLRQVESFRDPDYTRLLFRAMANARNFLHFLPGAVNAHKSPFMLAQGETFNLPWIQSMNVHNAFLFTEDAR